MAVESVELLSVAEDAGFKKRVSYFLSKKSGAMLDVASADANQLALAKTLLYPASTNTVQFTSVVERFAQGLVTVTAVASALAVNSFMHTAFSDAAFETQVNNYWTTYAKSTA